MTTHSDVLRKIIFDAVELEHPDPVSVEQFYSAVKVRVVLDADDLTPPWLHGKKVKEPSWQRNVRNVLQGAKAAGTLVNVQRNRWRLPSPDPESAIDVASAWELVRSAAELARADGTIYRSPVQGQRYRIGAVHESSITIDRLDSPKPDSLTREVVERAISYLNAAGGTCGRRALSHTVAKESALVELHPQLRRDEDTDSIVSIAGVVIRPVYRDFGQAPDDDPEALSRFARRVRAGQPIFRKNLLGLYEGRCAITGAGPAEVLEAAHINPHADCAINHTDNGLLLRSDIHTLFDLGLLRIDPDSLEIRLCHCLETTPYWTHHGARLRPRCDGSQPGRDYLRGRWDTAERLHDHQACPPRRARPARQRVGAIHGASQAS